MLGCQNLRTALVTGVSSLSLSVLRAFEGIGVLLCESFSLDGVLVTCNTPRNYKFGTVGTPLGANKVRISKSGEIEFCGPSAPSDDSSWITTDDIGSIDDDNFLTFISNKEEVIRTSNGTSVLPVPLEKKLKSHPLVSEAILIGNARPHLVALVTVEQGALRKLAESKQKSVSEALADEKLRNRIVRHLTKRIGEHIDEVNEKLADWQKVRAHTVLLREFSASEGEVSRNLRLNRKIIEERYKEAIDAMYSTD